MGTGLAGGAQVVGSSGFAPAGGVDRGSETLQPVAAVLALLLPGLGHWYLGERARARRIFFGVVGLFWFGVLVGGVDVIDRQEDPVWFAGQALVGPMAFGLDWVNQNHLKAYGLDAAGNLVLTDQRAIAPRRSLYPGEVVERRDVRTPGGVQTLRVAVAGPEGSRPPGTKSIGRVNELGTLFATIAGMLNLIVVIDAGFHRSRRVR